MYKKLFGCLAIVVIAIVAAINLNLFSTERLSDLSLANVEALAQGEGGELQCYNRDNYECCCNIYESPWNGLCPCGW